MKSDAGYHGLQNTILSTKNLYHYHCALSESVSKIIAQPSHKIAPLFVRLLSYPITGRPKELLKSRQQ